MESSMMIIEACAREEREEGATQQEIITKMKLLKIAGVSGVHQPECPACTTRSVRPALAGVSARATTTSHAPRVTTFRDETSY